MKKVTERGIGIESKQVKLILKMKKLFRRYSNIVAITIVPIS